MSVADTYAFVKRLTAAGMPEAQTEVLADEQRRPIDDRLATKPDLDKLEAVKKAQFANTATKSDVAEVKAEILKWMFGQTLLILGAVIAFTRLGH